MHTDIHTRRHASRHTWEKRVISTLPARQQLALREPGGNVNRAHVSQKRVSVCLGLSASACWSRLVGRSICFGLSVLVCLSRSVYLDLSVCVSVGQDTRTNARTHDVNNAVSPGPRIAHASATLIMRSPPASVTGVANGWSNLYQSSKSTTKHTFLSLFPESIARGSSGKSLEH